MNTRLAPLKALVLSLACAHCGAVVTSSELTPDAAPVDAAVVDVAAADAAPSPSCAAVRASCGALPQQFVRGHAEGLTGLEGARVQFAMLYLRESNMGIGAPRGVASAWGRVEGGAFEACVCLPRGGNEYPQLAAVVFAPGTVTQTRSDVARAVFSQRYATLGDEDLAWMIQEPPTDAMIDEALAAMIERE